MAAVIKTCSLNQGIQQQQLNLGDFKSKLF
jgi:hypothetical protein